MLAKKRQLEQQENEEQTPGCKLHVVNLMYPRTSSTDKPESRLLQNCVHVSISFEKRRGSIVYLSLSWSKSARTTLKHSRCHVIALALSQRFYWPKGWKIQYLFTGILKINAETSCRVCQLPRKLSIISSRFSKFFCSNTAKSASKS